MKTCIGLMVAIAFAIPAFAQNTRVEVAFGYSNLSLPSALEAVELGVGTGGHSGFALHQTVNLIPMFAMENYFGYYLLGRSSLAGKTDLITDVIGGKFSLRKNERVVPFVSAGFGGAFLEFPNLRGKSNGGLATKIGGGMDINLSRKVAWKTDISRMSFDIDGWRSGVSVSTGIVFKLTR